jgi:hypothetical protein
MVSEYPTNLHSGMDHLGKNTKYPTARSFLNCLIILTLSTGSIDLSGALNYEAPFYSVSPSPVKTSQKEGFIRGRITQLSTNLLVVFADIFNSNRKSFTKSNS